MNTISRTFLGLEGRLTSVEGSSVVLVPVPYDGTVSGWPGARFGPEAIVQASVQLEDYDLELDMESMRCGIHLADTVEPEAGSPEAMVDAVEQACRCFHDLGKFVFVLGGEHTVAVGAARAAAKRWPDLSFLMVDAHLDLRDRYHGSSFSHACTGRRLWELGPVTPVGVRSCSSEEMSWALGRKAELFTARRIADDPDDGWIDEVLRRLAPRVYVTFDVDGLDPSIMPATGTPVPGGLAYRTATKLLRRVAEEKEVVACDLCELAPRPGLHGAEYTAAQLVYKMIGYFVAAKQKTNGVTY